MLKHTILAVDDEVEILELYRKIFSAASAGEFDVLGAAAADETPSPIECRTYSDPEKLLADCRQGMERGIRHPLCILDMKMPTHAEGLETAEKLRAIDPDIDIVFCTANSKVVPAEIRGRLKDRVFFVLKPPNIEEFTMMIYALVDYWQSRQDLARETAFLGSLLESSQDLIFMKDRKGVYLTCNKRFADFAKKSAAEIIGETDRDFLPEQMCHVFREQDLQVIETGRPVVHRAEVDHPDGRRCLLETVKSPVYSAQRQCVGILGIARDIGNRAEHIAAEEPQI